MGSISKPCLFLVLLCLIHVPVHVLGQLRVGFYSQSCPSAESIIKKVVQDKFKTDRTIPAALLRMHFHDCFVRGCDASLLIDSTASKPSEKQAGPNQSVRGYDLIDQAKRQLEAKCPSKVSCADIVALATRDAVALAGGPIYSLPTGRRDGLVSNPNEVNLPGPSANVQSTLPAFQAKGMTLNDMVTLLGAHTVGITHCSLFQDRISNFQGTGRPDPSMDTTLLAKLRRTCSGSGDPSVFLDQNTSFVFDNEFYNQIRKKKGVLQLDQELTKHTAANGIVAGFARSNNGFKNSFAKAMVKLGNVQVLVGRSGEIRKNCRVFNKKG